MPQSRPPESLIDVARSTRGDNSRDMAPEPSERLTMGLTAAELLDALSGVVVQRVHEAYYGGESKGYSRGRDHAHEAGAAAVLHIIDQRLNHIYRELNSRRQPAVMVKAAQKLVNELQFEVAQTIEALGGPMVNTAAPLDDEVVVDG